MSLRDALLKAGKVSKKQAQQARTTERKKRKQKKGHVLEAEREASRQQLHEQQLAEQAAANRARAKAERQERERHEHAMRIGNLIRAWEAPAPRKAMRAFYYVKRDGRVVRTSVDRQLAMELEYGALAIVEHPATGAPHFVRREGVTRLCEIDDAPIRFYTGPGGPEDELVRPPKRADAPKETP